MWFVGFGSLVDRKPDRGVTRISVPTLAVTSISRQMVGACVLQWRRRPTVGSLYSLYFGGFNRGVERCAAVAM